MNNFLKSAALAATVFAVYGAVSTASADVVRFTVTGTDWSNIEGPSTGFPASVVEVFDVTDNAGTYSNPVLISQSYSFAEPTLPLSVINGAGVLALEPIALDHL